MEDEIPKEQFERGVEKRTVEMPINYVEIVGKNDTVVLFGEQHDNEGTFLELAAHAAELKANGINAMLIEAPCDQDFSAINAGDFSGIDDLVLGPDLQMMYEYGLGPSAEAIRSELAANGDGVKKARQQLIMALVKAGIPVWPIDDPDHWQKVKESLQKSFHTGEYEDLGIDERSRRSMKRRDITVSNIEGHVEMYGKVGVLIGAAHTKEGVFEYPDRPDLKHREEGQRLTDIGIPHHAVIFKTHIPTKLDPGRPPPKNPELDRFMYRDKSGILQVRVPVGQQEERIQMLGLL